MLRIGLVCIAMSAIGCVIHTGNSDPDPDPDAGSNPGGDIVPLAGSWYYAEVTPVSNTCGSKVTQAEGGDFAIDQTSLTGFRVLPNDGSAPFLCSLASSKFDCPNRAAATHDYRPGADIVLTYQVTANGTFSDPANGNGSQNATVTCSGTQCSALGASFPCNAAVSFHIAKF